PVDRRPGVPGYGLLEAGAHGGALGGEPRDVVAPCLTADAHLVGNDVVGGPAVDDAEVRGRLRIDAAEPHGRDGLGGDTDRADAALGRHAGVRRTTPHDGLDALRPRRAREHAARGVAVEPQTAPRRDLSDVEVARPDQAELFADRDDDVDG